MQASRNGVAVAPPQHWATFMEDEGVQLREQVPLAPYTTLGLGGEARYFVECGSEDEVRAALAYAAERRLPAYVLGGGSNVVFLDSGFPGLILRLTIRGIELRDGPSPEVRAGAGVDWDTLVQNVVQRGWTGVECLSGIPGTVGGTPIQNVGAYGQEIAERLVSVECLDRTTLERRTFTARECAFGYRDSRFKRADRGGMSCSRSRCGWLAISGRASAIRSCSAPWRSSAGSTPLLRARRPVWYVRQSSRCGAVSPWCSIPRTPTPARPARSSPIRCCRPPPSPTSRSAGRRSPR